MGEMQLKCFMDSHESQEVQSLSLSVKLRTLRRAMIHFRSASDVRVHTRCSRPFRPLGRLDC